MIDFNECISSKLLNGLWEIFSIFNGNPDTTISHVSNYGIRFSIGMFFSFYLFYIIKMRALITMKKLHIVAMVGALLIFIRYLVMFGFEWGYQIGLYSDPIVHFLFPPIEHFFYMMGLGCMAYYSLNHYRYYPGMIKKILPYIPPFITIFFVYATIVWKNFFLSDLSINIIRAYKDCPVDYQSHALIAIMSLYMVIVAIFKYSKYNHFLSAFWTVNFIEHAVRTIMFYYSFEPTWMATLFHATQLWLLPLLTLHFVQAYVIRLGYCQQCKRKTEITLPTF